MGKLVFMVFTLRLISFKVLQNAMVPRRALCYNKHSAVYYPQFTAIEPTRVIERAGWHTH